MLPAYVYGCILLCYLTLEIVFAWSEHNRQKGNSPNPLNPRLAVLLPFYNEKPEYIIACVNSILAQTYQNFEIVILDDGSKSFGTYTALVKAYHSHPKVKIVRNKTNRGKRYGQMDALALAGPCDYVVTLDSDTVFTPTCFAEMLSEAWTSQSQAVSATILVGMAQLASPVPLLGCKLPRTGRTVVLWVCLVLLRSMFPVGRRNLPGNGRPLLQTDLLGTGMHLWR